MKCIVFTNYGIPKIPKEVSDLYTQKFNEKDELARLDEDVISAIEALPWLQYDNLEYYKQITEEIKSKINRNDDETMYIFWEYGELYQFSIINVDITRPWGIQEYDGWEGIVYYDTLEPVCEDINFYRWKCDF